MKHVKYLVLLAGLCAGGVSYADNEVRHIYPGQFCQMRDSAVGNSLALIDRLGVFNTASNTRTILCPVPGTGVTELEAVDDAGVLSQVEAEFDDISVRVQVADIASNAGVNCILEACTRTIPQNEALCEADSATSSTSGTGAQNVFLSINEYNGGSDVVTVGCALPPPVGASRFGVLAYEVEEEQ